MFLADLDVKPCDACEACRKTARCVVRDDMIPLYDQLYASDVWVLGIWYAHESAFQKGGSGFSGTNCEGASASRLLFVFARFRQKLSATRLTIFH